MRTMRIPRSWPQQSKNWRTAMALAEAIRAAERHRLLLDGQEVEWRLVRSARAKKLRIKVGPVGVVVVLPKGRDDREASAFVNNPRAWVAEQLARVRQLQTLRRPSVRGD